VSLGEFGGGGSQICDLYMTAPAIVVVTGASGSGKTAAVCALESRALPGVRCYHFDAVGVPRLEDMCRDFGGPERWQSLTTQRWLERLAADPDGAEVYVLDGQTRPSFVRRAADRAQVALARVVLLDCAPPSATRDSSDLAGSPNSRIRRWIAGRPTCVGRQMR
jgi:hypothetical protein